MDQEEIAAAARAMEQLARLSGETPPTWTALAMVALQAAAVAARHPSSDVSAPARRATPDYTEGDVQRLAGLADVYGQKAIAVIGDAGTLVESSEDEIGRALQHVLRAARYGNKVLSLRSSSPEQSSAR